MAYLTHNSQLLKAVIPAMFHQSLSAVGPLVPGSVRFGSIRPHSCHTDGGALR